VKRGGLVLLILSVTFGACKRRSGVELSASDRKLLEKYSVLVDEQIPTAYLKYYRFIDTWWGTPYRLGGNSTQGVDCSGFVHQFYLVNYNKEIGRTTTDLYKTARKKKMDALEFGDLVFFDLNKSGRIGHVGIYLQNGRFVHASTSKGVRIDWLEDVYYSKQKKYGGVVE